VTHPSEDDLVLYFYGEVRRRRRIERHLDGCAACAALYRELSGTLSVIAAPDVPDRSDQYGLEVWQRLRHRLPELYASPWWAWAGSLGWNRFALAGAVAMLMTAAFVVGRLWTGTSVPPAAPSSPAATAESRIGEQILITSVAEHLDRSDRVLTDILNAPLDSGDEDISAKQRSADDLLATSRLYRQEAIEAGEQSVANILDDLERALLEIVHSPSSISAADLERIRRRIDAAALLFKVRVMRQQLRQRELGPAADRSMSHAAQETS